MIAKEHILAEICRTAALNEGTPLGMQRFTSETGIRKTDWYGTYWARWGDALREAGFVPNAFQAAYSEDVLLEYLVQLIRELGHYPVEGELRLKARNDAAFPAATTFLRLGTKHARAAKLIEYSRAKAYDDIPLICEPHVQASGTRLAAPPREELGFVYLLKFGRHYKIGRTNAMGRRERELAIQLPERSRLVHVIKTDDPVGIELYWHRRFEAKRGNGEWFALDAEDLAAFKRRKFM